MQGDAISPLLFNIVLEKIIGEVNRKFERENFMKSGGMRR